MADPVSWLMIEPGWHVLAADGTDVGRVEEVTGDSGADIFDGLAISFSALGRQHYVPSEQVGEITQGAVKLKLDRDAVEHLGEFLEPPIEAQIEPEGASRLARLESKLTVPPERRATRAGLGRRILLWLGLTGRR
jgi:hypothetical protein